MPAGIRDPNPEAYATAEIVADTLGTRWRVGHYPRR